MKANRTIIGLIAFLFHSARGNISIALLVCSVLGIAFLATGISAFHTFFVLMTIIIPPYSIITSIAGGYASKHSSKWERFQIAMPVRRRDVTSSQYLCIIIATLVGIPFVVIIIGMGIAIHESLSDIAREVISSTVTILSMSIGIALLFASLFFPLTCAKFSKNRVEALATVGLLAAIGIIGAITLAGSNMNVPQYTMSFLRIAVSVIPFVFSYLLTKKLYARLDL